jgi:hypothetical protein
VTLVIEQDIFRLSADGGERIMADARGSEARSSATMPVALSLEAARWLDELPGTVRPERTAARFPHIANNLCTRWPTPQACLAYFDELVLDNRGGRAGFPPLIARELALLKDYYESVVHPTQQTIWDELVRRPRSAAAK